MKNNVEEIYEQLQKDGKEAFGDPDITASLFDNPCYCWQKENTRLYVAMNTMEQTNYTLLAIQHLSNKS